MAYQRVTVFPLQSGVDQTAMKGLAERFAGLLAELDGHRSTCMDLLADGSQLRSVSVWDSEAAAEAATARIREPATQEMTGMLTGPPTTTIGEVIEGSVH
jgi:hypothetical protein